ncbi:acyl-CoA dehydrogenase/oxidase C-terminal [Dissophora ornata]|nr:acyl-CoA dehydrogenase/oxidase C-terminal [Dissophora ornata]
MSTGGHSCVTATKWWIGRTTHTTTHCVVFTQLIVRGKCCGTKSFVAQVRSTHTYNLTLGVNIGKKMGYDGIHNGRIQFTNICIPRTSMLMMPTKVSHTGEVKDSPMAQLTYADRIQGRVAVVVDSDKLIGYAIHQYRLMPRLAQAYAPHFTDVETNKLYEELMDKLESTHPDDASMGAVIDTLKKSHATLAVLEAFCTWSTLNAIEAACRQTLGGHGYSAYTGIATTYNDFSVHCTCHGDSTILNLQSGHYLVNRCREALTGMTQPEGVDYLNHLDTLLTQGCAIKTLEKISDFDVIHKLGAVKSASEGLRPILTKICLLHGLYSIKQNSWFFLQCRYFTPSHICSLSGQFSLLRCSSGVHSVDRCIQLFRLHDHSAFGVYDGNVYEKCFDQAKRQDPVGQPHLYLTLIQSLLYRDIEDDEPLEDGGDDDGESRYYSAPRA